MCVECRQTPCVPGCPNEPEPEHKRICAVCGEPIYTPAYYQLLGKCICPLCVEDAWHYDDEE